MKLIVFLVAAALAHAEDFDILIKNGRIVDGTGNPSWVGDVGVLNGKIAAMGRLAGKSATQTIDATGLTVAPGFIDIHNHSDYTLLTDGNAESMIRQGVTSMILGEGGSAAPVGGKQEKSGDPADWTDFTGYFARLLKGGIAPNVGTYVGSSQIWTYVHGPQAGPASAAELKQMQDLVRAAMRQGALGVASSLSGPPGSWIDTDTLIAMCRAASESGGIYSTHMRTEGIGVFESVAEAIRIGREGGVPVDVIHLKLADQTLWGKMPELVGLIAQARANGQEVTANVYPYRAGQNNLSSIVPPWAHEGGSKALIARLKDPALRPRLEQEIEHGIPGSNWYNHYTATGSWEGMLLVSLSNPAYKKYQGKRMNEVIAAMGVKPLDALFTLLEENGGSVPTVYFHHDEKDMRYALRQPFVSIGSDGLAFKTEGPLSQGNPHPRSYGTFPRVLGRYVREEPVITMEEAIRKMTSANAGKVHVFDRGLLRPGVAADITVFDAARIVDNATYAQPHQYATGVEYVVVNGRTVLARGKHTGLRPGVILYGPGVQPLSDRQVAQWALRQGGGVRLNGSRNTIRDAADLPVEDFRITSLDLIGTTIDPKELSKLSGLSELRELLLPGPIFNPGAGSTLDANDELQALVGLAKLEKLYFSLHFLTNINVQDKGLERLKGLTHLRELRLAQTEIKGGSLANFPQLTDLDLNDTRIRDEGMKALERLKHLQTLSLRDTLITDEGLKSITGLTELTALDLYGVKMTDAGLRALSGLHKLRKLNVLGAQITDDGLDALARMTDLEELNLYRSEITNTGLEKLKRFPHLASLDLRYSRVTRGGVDSFLAALPRCRVDFQDSVPRVAGANAGRPADRSLQAITEWVKKMGGSVDWPAVSLANTSVTDAQLEYLAVLPLTRLDLETTQISDAGLEFVSRMATLEELNLANTTTSDKSLAKLEKLSRLRKLILNNTYVQGPGLAALVSLQELELAGTRVADVGLAELAGLQSLRHLRLDYTDIGDAGLKHLEALPALRSLDLSAADITDDGLATIAKLTNLTELLLNYGRFTDKGVQQLSSLANLQRLELARTRTGDDGVKALAGLKQLRRLNLDYTSVTDAGLAALPQIEELHLDSTGLTDNGLSSLSKMSGLRYVNLYHTLVSEKGMDGLKKQLPNCRIVFDRDSSLPNRRHS
jgi:N-acyl-D-aspartate/D-glutamate deacylase/Leucine-rich repeat (LRR) protein